MFKYVYDISTISHNIIKSHINTFEIAVDATLGNGHDTDFLSEIFNKVYAFDIQNVAINKYASVKKENVTLICDSHDNLEEYIKEQVDCFMYNLGFLPKGDKTITTKSDTTIKSIKTALKLLKKGGLITVGLYDGHEEGKKEKEDVLELVSSLNKKEFGVLYHQFINRRNNPPSLLVIEKNSD